MTEGFQRLDTPELAVQARAAHTQLHELFERYAGDVPRIREGELKAIKFTLPPNESPDTPIRDITVEPQKSGTIAIDHRYGGGPGLDVRLGGTKQSTPVAIESDGQVHSQIHDQEGFDGQVVTDFITGFDSYAPLLKEAKAVAIAEIPLRRVREQSVGSRILKRVTTRP